MTIRLHLVTATAVALALAPPGAASVAGAQEPHEHGGSKHQPAR